MPINDNTSKKMSFFLSFVDSKLEKYGGQTGHDDEDLFKERLKNMGKCKQPVKK